VKVVPGAQKLVDTETDKIVGKLAESISQHDLGASATSARVASTFAIRFSRFLLTCQLVPLKNIDLRRFNTLPSQGVSEEELLELLKVRF
jgi:hypothetical protein